jgi:hypothetical protein
MTVLLGFEGLDWLVFRLHSTYVGERTGDDIMREIWQIVLEGKGLYSSTTVGLPHVPRNLYIM